MLRRVNKTDAKHPIQQQRRQQGAPRVFIGKVGGPYPAPCAGMNGNLPSMDMNMNMNIGITGTFGGNRGYNEKYLDDFRALHYYGLDNYDNIDF